MPIATIDFETFYDKTYSLSKITTEEYVRDDQFEVIGVAVKIDDGETEWFSGTHAETAAFLGKFELDKCFVLAHNTMFDGAILSWRFNIKPLVLLDTLSMARAVCGIEVGNSLAKLAERYDLGVKGTEVVMAMGKRRAHFSDEEMQRYAAYCRNDVDLTYKLFHLLNERFSKTELKLIDLTLRMFTEPALGLDLPLLEQHLIDVVDRKEELIAKAAASRETLMSNDKFAEALRELGVYPPTKISPTTNKRTYAFAKSDEGLKALADHPDDRVQALVAARLGTKSTLEETRTQRMCGIAKRGKMPVPLRYYAAHTGRWGGDDKMNLQNLPRKSKLKSAITAPEGYVLIDADSSQIEARILAWLAGQNDLVEAFEKGEDVYKIMASKIYRKGIEDINDRERFVGKTTVLGCFGADTKVLTSGGWKRIVDVHATDMLWDGEEWVTHLGVVPKGEQQTIRAWGVDATPDHEILTEHGWREWHEVTTNRFLSRSAFAKARSLSWSGSNTQNPQGVPLGGTLSSNATAGGRDWLTATTSKHSGQPDATHALKARLILLAKNIGDMRQSSQTLRTDKDYSTGLQALFLGAIQRLARRIFITADAASQCMSLGAQTERLSCVTSLAYPTGTTQHATLTEWITQKGMRRGIFGLLREARTQETSAGSRTLKHKLPTYDIAYAGPRNRYTIATSAGPLIVHNCGYGMGWVKFQLQLATMGVKLDESMCKLIMTTYRDQFVHIPGLWNEASKCLDALTAEQLKTTPFGTQEQAVRFLPGIGFDLPSGIPLRYGDLRPTSASGTDYIYMTRRGPVRIYGGKIVENVCQALARCVIGEQMLRVAKKYKVVLTVHDAVTCIAKEDEWEEAVKYVQGCMRWRPKWALTLPLNCEVKYGRNYGTTTKYPD